MNGIKPPYKIPSMAEIESIPWNGYNVVSTFSGGGGSCLGYRMAGFRVLWANEFVEEAQRTYRANHPGVILDTRDIRDISPESILRAIRLEKGQVDLFDGSPPCCAFSTIGVREKGWNQARNYSDGKTQQVENLFLEYIRILEGLKPKTFIAENVSGLVKGVAVGWFKEFLRDMKSCGYRVKAQLLNAQWLGVPQKRERLIFIGVREDLNIEPVFPKPLPYCYTVGDALEGVVNDPEEERVRYERIQGTKMGEILKRMKKDSGQVQSGAQIMNGKWFSMTRQSMKQPCSTLLTSSSTLSGAGIIHPIYDRKFTIAETKRIASIPDDFILTGNYDQQAERLGRMVPPIMMKNISATIQKEVLDKCKIT
jgi:DNA (cytosine-5)-methyltransferase 1